MRALGAGARARQRLRRSRHRAHRREGLPEHRGVLEQRPLRRASASSREAIRERRDSGTGSSTGRRPGRTRRRAARFAHRPAGRGPSRPRRAACPRPARRSRPARRGSPGTRPSSSSRISPSVMGSSASPSGAAGPCPSRLAVQSSGRARVTTRIGSARDQSRRCSMKSSRPSSAHWRSSKTSTVVPRSAIRSKKRRQAGKSTSRLGRLLDAEQGQQRRFDAFALARVRRRTPRGWPHAPRSSAVGILCEAAATPNHLAEGPEGDPLAVRRRAPPVPVDSSATPSTYFSSSQTSRLLPIPPGPVIETSASAALARPRGAPP